jgi:hypothetical protein
MARVRDAVMSPRHEYSWFGLPQDDADENRCWHGCGAVRVRDLWFDMGIQEFYGGPPGRAREMISQGLLARTQRWTSKARVSDPHLLRRIEAALHLRIDRARSHAVSANWGSNRPATSSRVDSRPSDLPVGSF